MTKEQLEKIRAAALILANLSNEEWEKIYEMLEEPNEEEDVEQKMEDRVEKLIRKLGVQPNLKGYKYLKTAIMYYMTTEERILVTKELYPGIAQEFNDSPGRVERAIRTAITTMWERQANWNLFAKIFGEDSEFLFKRPSNSKFITIISEYLKAN